MARYHLTVPANLIDIRAVSAWIGEIAVEAPLPTDMVGRIDLGLTEICTNIVTHGYGEGSDEPPPDDHGGTIELKADVTPTSLDVTIVDRAPSFDPDSVPAPEPGESTVHGYGLMIVRQLTDHLSVERVDGRNVWSLAFPTLADASSQATQT